MKHQQRGFTLIELVIVIVLIGILAATALPKFVNLTGQARTAAAQGFAGALGAAVNIAHAAWLAAGLTGAGNVNLENNSVSVNANGWPDHTGGLAPTAANCASIVTDIVNNPPTVATTACAAPNNNCYQANNTATCNGNAAACGFVQSGSGTVVGYDPITGRVCSP